MSVATNCDVQVQFTARNSLAKRTSRANLTINVLLILYIILALLLNGGFVPLAKRGFFCGDSTIQYPVKTDTISFGLLLVISLFIPILFIRYCDVTLGKLFLGTDDISRIEKRRKISDCQNVSPGGSSARNGDKEDRVKRRLVVNDDDDAQEEQNLCKVLDESGMEVEYAPKSSTMMGLQSSRNFTDTQLYLFGFATTALFTGIGKTTCGRLRPHFMQRCKPDIACGAVDNLHRYIYDFQCKNELRSRDITYISTSWPSGHASIMFYSMVYLILYIHTVILVSSKRFRHQPITSTQLLLISFIDTLLLGLAIYISMTRISDYHHHPTDVLSGSILGAFVAVLQAKYILGPVYNR